MTETNYNVQYDNSVYSFVLYVFERSYNLYFAAYYILSVVRIQLDSNSKSQTKSNSTSQQVNVQLPSREKCVIASIDKKLSTTESYGKCLQEIKILLLLLLLSAAPIQGSPQRMFVKHPHKRFGSVLRWMPFLMQPTGGRET